MGLALLEEEVDAPTADDSKEMLFCAAIEASTELKIVAVDDVACSVSNTKGGFFRVSWETVVQEPLEELLSILHEEREAVILGHMTRIVGYYSQTSNWNKSKLGELEARRKAVKFYTI